MPSQYLPSPTTKPSQRKTICLLMGVAGFLYLRTFLLPGTPLAPQNDAVFFFEHAKRIMAGEMPFRDYLTFVMPGTDLLYAGIFYIFGVHAWVAALIPIVLGLALTATVLKLSTKILHGGRAFLAPVLFLIFDFDNALDATHHWYSTLLVLSAALVLLPGRTDRRLLLAGGLCGMATVFTQSQGAVGFLAVALFLLFVSHVEKQPRSRMLRQLGLFVLPFATILGGVLGYFAHEAGSRALIYALWTYSFLFAATQYKYPLFQLLTMHSSLQEVARSISQIGLFLFVPLVYASSVVRLIRNRNSIERQLWQSVLLINLVGAALFTTLAAGPTYHRLCTVAPAAFIAFLWLLEKEGRSDAAAQLALWTVSGVLFVTIPIRLQLKPRQYFKLPIGRAAFLSYDQYSREKWLAGTSHKGDPFLGLTAESFSLGLTNPTPVDLVSQTSMTPPALEDSVVSALRKQPPVVMFLPKIAPWDDRDRLPRFFSFVHSHYHLAKQFPSGEFWVVN
jgi:hypothetical protein